MKSFEYMQSHKIIYWGSTFDSILELKYAISIQEDFDSLRAHIPIYYDPNTRRPTFYIRDNIRRYTPDFLIRHKHTNEAFLVEVKPRAFEHNQQLVVRREIAENFIRLKKYDWTFKVVFDDEIKLNFQQQMIFDHCRNLKRETNRLLSFQAMNDKYDASRPSFFTRAPSNRIIQQVMFGTSRRVP